LIEPTLVFGHPVEISPLAKPMAEDRRYAERFEIFIAGMECGDNWSEQNDPIHLLNTWKRSYKPEERDSGEFHTLDFDFIEALLDRERAGRAVENADPAESRVDAEVLVAGDDHDGGELLDPLDAARPAGEELVEPQVWVGGVDGQHP